MNRLILCLIPGMAMAEPAIPTFITENGGISASYQGDYLFTVAGACGL